MDSSQSVRSSPNNCSEHSAAEIPTTPLSIDTTSSATEGMTAAVSPAPVGRFSPGHTSPLRLDLSDMPGLIQPTPPSNTLLITNLDEPSIFHPQSLQTIHDLINTHAPIHAFAPLKSFRRIVVSFFSIEDATLIRTKVDGTQVMNCRARVYFGVPTPLNPEDQHLQAPKSQKLFFISPPPSPPAGWEMRNEEPPNKDVHAEDLASALSKLHARNEAPADMPLDAPSPVTPEGNPETSPRATRHRSGSTLVFDPSGQGHSPDLPAVMVEDTTESPTAELESSPMEGVEMGMKITRTSRPPVELMNDA